MSWQPFRRRVAEALDYSTNLLNILVVTLAHCRFKDSLYDQLARIGKAMASPKRLELLDLLSQAPRTVEALAEQSSLSVANTSQHLQVLRAAKLVTCEKQGLYVEYRLAGHDVAALFVALRALGEARIPEVLAITHAYFSRRGALEPVAAVDLMRRVRAGEVTVIDVRPEEEFRAGHLPGARSIPVDELVTRLAEVPAGRDVVAYCRGPFCVMAVEAVAILRERGFTAHQLDVGVVEWRARGWRVVGEGASA